MTQRVWGGRESLGLSVHPQSRFDDLAACFVDAEEMFGRAMSDDAREEDLHDPTSQQSVAFIDVGFLCGELREVQPREDAGGITREQRVLNVRVFLAEGRQHEEGRGPDGTGNVPPFGRAAEDELDPAEGHERPGEVDEVYNVPQFQEKFDHELLGRFGTGFLLCPAAVDSQVEPFEMDRELIEYGLHPFEFRVRSVRHDVIQMLLIFFRELGGFRVEGPAFVLGIVRKGPLERPEPFP